MLTGLFWDTVDSFAGLFDGFYYMFTGESTSKADKFNNLGSMKIPNTPLTQKRSVIRTARSVLGILCFSRGLECMMACGCIRRFCSVFQICIKMSFLNYHDCPWRATADLVRGRVSSRVPAWLLALSGYASIIGCLLSCFDWTSRYRGGSSKMITTQGLLKTASSATLFKLPRASMYLSCIDAATEEEEEGTGVASDVVKLQGEDLAAPGPLP
jgi:hypothetical protein